MVGVGMSRPDVDPTLKLDVEHESSPDSGQKKKKNTVESACVEDILRVYRNFLFHCSISKLASCKSAWMCLWK